MKSNIQQIHDIFEVAEKSIKNIIRLSVIDKTHDILQETREKKLLININLVNYHR
jgi:hypothetical protein